MNNRFSKKALSLSHQINASCPKATHTRFPAKNRWHSELPRSGYPEAPWSFLPLPRVCSDASRSDVDVITKYLAKCSNFLSENEIPSVQKLYIGIRRSKCLTIKLTKVITRGAPLSHLKTKDAVNWNAQQNRIIYQEKSWEIATFAKIKLFPSLSLGLLLCHSDQIFMYVFTVRYTARSEIPKVLSVPSSRQHK